jgi:8-oxo-dGTP diphosphatase
VPPWLEGDAAAAAASANKAAARGGARVASRLATRDATREAERDAATRASRSASGSKPYTMLVSAAALLDGQGRVLLAQRPVGKKHAGKWEFPGGKVGAP